MLTIRSVGLNASARTLLVFHDLDTIANITVAGHPTAGVNNQFRQYVYNVTNMHMLASPSESDSNITVAFESAYFYGLIVTSLPGTEVSLISDFGYASFRQYERKIQFDFGWDWGPAFVSAGIFRPAYLVMLSETSLEISKLGQTALVPPDQTADWLVNVTLGVRSVLPSFNLTTEIAIPKLDISSGPIAGVPQRWYPRDLGTPTLYNFTITLALGDEFGMFLDSTSFQLQSGFRTIELAQTAYLHEEIDLRGITPGDQWHFVINGRAFYTKGTNIIPFDLFYPRITTEKVRWVLESTVLSGQNMLRVWGGGIYQPSDELTGSEMIFSDATYPLNEFLLNVRRINKHPSNVQWAGGNEIENIVIGVNDTYANGTHYLDEDFLHDITYQEQSSVAYTDCFTMNGNKTPGYIYGNTERYNYNASQAFNYSTYPVASFHSMPSFYTWEEALLEPEDYLFNSTVVMSRYHHPPAGSLTWPNLNAPQGQGQMTMAVEPWLPMPGTFDSNQIFAQWCWSTQAPRENLGALVWQLNEIWQAPSWAAIEYSGRWKVLNYGMASIYSPMIVYPFWTSSNETLDIMVTNDRWYTMNGTALLTWYDWAGNQLETMMHEFSMPSLNNTVLMSMQGFDMILPEGAHIEGRTAIIESYYTPTSLANAELIDPEIDMIAGDSLTFTLSAKGGVAAYAWLDHPSGKSYIIDPISSTLHKPALSMIRDPDRADFVVRSVWNDIHV
ncbi:glycoside hydrolase family 2 protein [Laetiporus sulphureus 93-53]|uniref:Beta-mannosidase A n=1 Tax=Laetiporus sulphureus 93-53 TaxID=1314785 RepID=A0A165D3H3_9APHY|nr:glycoside hydrolase family 2 protein [Laetiporus sulphureus 93-53]KZT04086.1 glycoside hydrolase family 2 protein [Laetiporus sulphureus 93-53]